MIGCPCILCTGTWPANSVFSKTEQVAAIKQIQEKFAMPSVPVTNFIGSKKKPKGKPKPTKKK